MRDEDAKRAAEDPSYKPKFGKPSDQKEQDGGYDLKKRLAEERRKHRLDQQEQFEEDLGL